jgi:phenylacetate-CoA ligase
LTHSETGCAAAECEQHQGLHLSEDLVIFEIVDENNHPVPPGVFGEKALITVLFNRTQPLIRYELNDSARRAATPCRCGRPYALVDAIQGRMEDVLRFPAVRGGEVAVHPNVFDTVMDMVPATGWQVVLEAEGLRVLISGVHNEFVDKTLEDALRKALDAQGMVVPPIRVERVPVIPRGPTGKAPLIKCNLSHSSIAQPSA